jgi:hypothetical protein
MVHSIASDDLTLAIVNKLPMVNGQLSLTTPENRQVGPDRLSQPQFQGVCDQCVADGNFVHPWYLDELWQVMEVQIMPRVYA